MRLITSLIASLLFFQYAYAIKLGELELQKEQPSGVKLVVPVKNINYDGYSTLSLKVRSDNKTINKMQFAINKVNKDSITLNSLEKIVIDKPIVFTLELAYQDDHISRTYQVDKIVKMSKENKKRSFKRTKPLHVRVFEQKNPGYIEGKIYLDGVTKKDKLESEISIINGDPVDVYIDETSSSNHVIYVANEQYYKDDTILIVKINQGSNSHIRSFRITGGGEVVDNKSIRLNDDEKEILAQKKIGDLSFYLPSLLNEPIKYDQEGTLASKDISDDVVSDKEIKNKISTVVYQEQLKNDLDNNQLNQAIEQQNENVYVNWSYQIREMPPIMKNIMGEQN